MKKNLPRIILLIALTISFISCEKEKAAIVYDKQYIDEIKEIRKELAFYLTRNYIPGATFAVALDGKIVYSEGIGFASKDLEVDMNRDNKLRIGDVSELFTSLIYMKMLEEGTLHKDSTVQHYLPDFPELNYKLTLDNLVNHTSGIRPLNSEEIDWRGLNISIQKGIENFKNDSLIFYPGWYQETNMYNYNLLGAVMEEATGKRFPLLLKEYVTDTLNLDNTLIDDPFRTIKGRTDFYDHNFVAQTVNATFRDMRYRAPSQGLLSNAEDLVKFGNAILNSDYISEDIKNTLFEPIILKDGFPATLSHGWMLSTDLKGRRISGRSGQVTGGGASLLIFPDVKLVIAGAINLTADMDDIPVFQIAGHFLTDNEIINPVRDTIPE